MPAGPDHSLLVLSRSCRSLHSALAAEQCWSQQRVDVLLYRLLMWEAAAVTLSDVKQGQSFRAGAFSARTVSILRLLTGVFAFEQCLASIAPSCRRHEWELREST